ncbi:MAG: DUF4433 domain-containing protein [Candidatus Nanopelagicales bacterium]|nr:DUF4433 domain-containing protein [Candidatus Nanopelagicales bacterium]
MHFTHIDHLESVVDQGLVADAVARVDRRLAVEVGNLEIKERRRKRVVPVGPGGFVGDYVPFYFAPRSPMMYVIHKGGVPTFSGGCARLVYLVTSVEKLESSGLSLVFADRNAVLGFARFTERVGDLDALVDWPLMRAMMWNNTSADPDRRERRMAECLAHRVVPWPAIECVVAASDSVAREVRGILATACATTPVNVLARWYF